MNTFLKLTAVAVSAFGIAGGAALAQTTATTGTGSPAATGMQGSGNDMAPNPGNATGAGMGSNKSAMSSPNGSANSATGVDSSSPDASLQPRPDRN